MSAPAIGDDVALAAARLLGYVRPHRRTPTADLEAEAEYAERGLLMLDAEGLGHEDGGLEELAAYFLGALDGLREELASRRALAQTIRAPARISADTIERIRAAVPCQEFVQWGGFVDLQPHPRYAPRYWVGLCPFHVERTPSFTVWPTHFVCFGCGARGDVFRYARLRGKLSSFADAVRAVGAYAGIDPTPRPKRKALDL